MGRVVQSLGSPVSIWRAEEIARSNQAAWTGWLDLKRSCGKEKAPASGCERLASVTGRGVVGLARGYRYM